MRSDNPTNVSESDGAAVHPVSSESASGSGAAQQHDGPTLSIVSIRPDVLKGLSNVATDDDGRYAMHTVRLEPGRALATNGRIAAIVRLAPLSDIGTAQLKTPVLIARDFAATAAKEGKRDATGDVWLHVNGAVHVDTKRGQRIETRPVDVTFPDVDSIVPAEHADDILVSLNAVYLAQLQAAIFAGSKDAAAYVTLRIPRKFSASKPIKVEGNQGFGLIMPCDGN